MGTSILLILSLTLVAAVAFALGYQVGKDRERKQNAEAQQLQAVVSRLPHPQPMIFGLYSRGYNFLEIAAKLGMEKDYVLTELSKGFATLREQQGPEITRERGRVYLFVARHVLSRM